MMKREQNLTLGIMLALLLAVAGCAKLPLDNGAPSAPELALASSQINNVAIQVMVDDPDGDRVTLKFRATNALGAVVDFSWTSFVDSGSEEIFYLGLGLGQWTISAQAKDE